ncbi:VOC family protein [Mesorhizobium sp. M0676]|uniref:VOC family protein n=1 Tax=Mesorhizobium sp. M0676 TaxID=2956984 RepID=UPI00333998F7
MTHVVIYVSDVKDSLAFYSMLLGLKVNFSRFENEDVASVQAGGIDIILHHDRDLPAEERAPRGRSIFIEFGVENVDEEFDRLRGKALIVREPVTMSFGLRQGYIADPDGFLICLSSAE